jgi:hypothetical protein
MAFVLWGRNLPDLPGLSRSGPRIMGTGLAEKRTSPVRSNPFVCLLPLHDSCKLPLYFRELDWPRGTGCTKVEAKRAKRVWGKPQEKTTTAGFAAIF